MSEERLTFDPMTGLEIRCRFAAENRRTEAKIISQVIDHHRSTGGSCETVLDVDCANGETTRLLATHFITALGIDKIEKNVQRSIEMSQVFVPDKLAAGRIKFAVGDASRLSESTRYLSDSGKVDLVAACGVAHSFNSSAFWHSSAQVLNKGGTAVLLTASTVCHPSTRNRDQVQEILSYIERQSPDPYKVAGTGGDMHETLVLLPSENSRHEANAAEAGERILRWEKDPVSGTRFWYWTGRTTLMQLENWLATSVVYKGWRVRNPHLKDTPEDLVHKTIRQLKKLLPGNGLIIGCMIKPVLFKKNQ